MNANEFPQQNNFAMLCKLLLLKEKHCQLMKILPCEFIFASQTHADYFLLCKYSFVLVFSFFLIKDTKAKNDFYESSLKVDTKKKCHKKIHA